MLDFWIDMNSPGGNFARDAVWYTMLFKVSAFHFFWPKTWRFSYARGTRDSWTPWRSLSPMKYAPSYVLTSIILTTLRTDRQRPIVEFNRRGRVFPPFLVAVWSRGSAITVGPVRSALSAQDELLPARPVIHRQTSAREQRR